MLHSVGNTGLWGSQQIDLGGNASDLYSVDAGFESRLGHRLFCLRYFVGILSPYRQVRGAYRPVATQRLRNKQRVQPLLCNRTKNKRPFLRNVLVNTSTISELSLVNRRNLQSSNCEGRCFLLGPLRGYIKRTTGQLREIERVQLRDCGQPGTTWEREAEESPVARERLVKTQQAGKSLVGAVMICKVWRLAIVL
jgi:hypothetical protein